MDIDPIFAEITIRRLEHYIKTGKTGWQFESSFPDVDAVLQVESEDRMGSVRLALANALHT